MTATEESSQNPKYKRIILKLSGEVLRNNEDGEPIDPAILKAICEEVKKVYDIGVEIGQLAIVAPLYILMRCLRPPARIYLMIIQIPASVVIASIGLYWTAERLGWWPI